MLYSRRAFVSVVGAGVLGPGLVWPRLSFAQPSMPVFPGKDPGLILLSAKPLVAETPLDLLAKDAITPTSRLFIRNNQDWAEAMTLDPKPLEGWSIEFKGLVDKPATLAASDLAKLDQVSVEMVLQCSGNGRAQYSKTAKTEGTQWGPGGFGNITFRGVPFAAVLEYLKIKPKAEARFVTANGKEEPAPMKDDFEHSLPIADVLKKSLLALEMNGQPLPALHGGPVRLITPGFFATMQVKWLTQVRFEAAETRVNHQLPRYRVPNEPIAPGTDYPFTFENSRPNYRMNVKSTILTPLTNGKLTAGKSIVQGVAFNDGQAPITAVLISTDKGQSWAPARLQLPKDLHAWTRWETAVNLTAGAHEIWSMAIDKLGRTQPLDGSVFWNPHGYEWNGVDKVAVSVS